MGNSIMSMLVSKMGAGRKEDYPSLIVTPDLAESWEVTSDGLQYTFKLHRNAYFHPPLDRVVTSEDV